VDPNATISALTQRVDELEKANKSLNRRLEDIEAEHGILRGGVRVRPWVEMRG